MSSSSLTTHIEPTTPDIRSTFENYNTLNGFLIGQAKEKAKKIVDDIFGPEMSLGSLPVKDQLQKEKTFVKKEIRALTEKKLLKHPANDEMEPAKLVKLWDELTPLDLDEDVYQKALKMPGELLQKLLSFNNPRQAIIRCINCQASFLTYPEMLAIPNELLEACMDLAISDGLLQDLLMSSQEKIEKILALKDIEKIKKQLRTYHYQPSESYYFELVESRLCTSKNKPAPSPLSTLTQHQPILIASLTDEKVKNKTFSSIDTHISFKNEGGYCKGMSNEFAMLYFLLQPVFKSPKACLTAVAKQFQNGAGNESILMQSLAIGRGKLIDLQIDESLMHSKLQSIDSDKLYQASSPAEILPKIEAGVYVVRFETHRCVYVKPIQGPSFYFNPSKGLFQLDPKTQDADLILLLKQSCKNIPDHYVEFAHCQPRDSFPKLEIPPSQSAIALHNPLNQVLAVIFMTLLALVLKG